MIRSRINPHPPSMSHLSELAGPASPSAWVRAALKDLGGAARKDRAFVLLLGSCDLLGFRVRVAQSQLRADALPGFFSSAALLLAQGREAELVHVPLVGREPAGSVPRRNGIERWPLSLLDERPGLYPNLALLWLPVEDATLVRTAVATLRAARLSDDFVSPIPAWLSYAWSCDGSQQNPLSAGVGCPSAMFVESCYAACGVDVAPGMSERILSPEVIWQGIKWWPDTFGGHALARFRLGQPDAAVSVED